MFIPRTQTVHIHKRKVSRSHKYEVEKGLQILKCFKPDNIVKVTFVDFVC